MQSLKLTIAAAALAASALPASLSGQNLTQEITVDHEIVPEKREANMPALTPVIDLPTLSAPRLEFASAGIPVPVTPVSALMAPAATGDSLTRSPWRGYLAAGYLPLYNLGLSAGYRFIDSPATRLSAALQFDGMSYDTDRWRGFGNDPGSHTLQRNAINAMVDFATRLDNRSSLAARLNYGFARFNQPFGAAQAPVELRCRNINRFDLGLGWKMQASNLSASVGVDFGLFGQKAPVPDAALWSNTMVTKPNRQTHFAVRGEVTTPLSESSALDIDVSFSLLANTASRDVTRGIGSLDEIVYHLGNSDNYTNGLLTLRPAYTYTSGSFRASAGVRIEASFNAGKTFHIAPDVTLGWRPIDQIALRLHAGGGEWQNTAARLYAANPYAAPWLSYGYSHLPVTADAALTIGPFKGVALELTGAYAAANDWLMPVVNGHETLFAPVDLRGWKFGAALTYTDGRWGNLRLAYERTPGNSYSRAWLEWADRARQQFTAEVTVRPMPKLEINVSWHLRTGRKILDQLLQAESFDQPWVAVTRHSLSSEASLDLGGRWSFTDRFSVFARGENLTGRHYSLTGYLPSAGIRGLAGITFKF